MSILRALILTIFLIPAAAQAADRFEVAGLDQTRAEQFLANLQKAVAQEDKVAVSKMVSYPIDVHIHGKSKEIGKSATLVENYAAIMTDKVTAAIKDQKPGDLFVNAQGVMIGDGEIWYTAVCQDAACDQAPVQIIAINN